MAKFKLNRPVLLQEEFAAGEVSNPGQNVTPAAKTEPVSVAVDKTDAKGAEIRAEIIADVDTILTNLETLSKQITEDIDRQYDALIESLENEIPLNEADFMEAMKKAFADMKNYGIIKSAYPTQKKAIMNAQVAKASALAEFDDKMAGEEEKLIDKLKETWKEKIAQAGQQYADNLAKKKKAQEKLRTMRDANIEQAQKGSIKKKIDAKKAALTTAEDAKIKKLTDKLAELEKDFPISGDSVLGKQWAIEKSDIDTQISMETTEKKTKAETEYMDDPEKVKARMERDAEALKKKEQEGKENAKEFADELKTAEQKAAQAEAEAANDPTKKPAVEAVKNYFAASKKYIQTLGSIDPSEDIPEDQQANLKTARKEYNTAKDALSNKKMVDAGYAKDKDEAQELITTLTTNVTQAVDAYKEVQTKADQLETDAKNAKQEQLDNLKDELKELKATLSAAGEPSTPEQPNQEYDDAKAAVDAKQAEIDELKNSMQESVQVQETEDLEEGNAFGAARAEAIAKGEKTFKVGDEEYDVESVDAEDKENAEEFAGESVTESASFKMGSIADRFRSLM